MIALAAHVITPAVRVIMLAAPSVLRSTTLIAPAAPSPGLPTGQVLRAAKLRARSTTLIAPVAPSVLRRATLIALVACVIAPVACVIAPVACVITPVATRIVFHKTPADTMPKSRVFSRYWPLDTK